MSSVLTLKPLPSPLPLKANLGCGYDYREGYLNIDDRHTDVADFAADVSKLDMLPANHFEHIVAQDVLEHISRVKTQEVLDSWTRLLKPDGTIFIRVPSFLHLAKMMASPENRTFEQQSHIIHLAYGTQAYPGDFHLTCFTPTLLLGLFDRAGLKLIHSDLRFDWLFEVVGRRTSELTDPAELLHEFYFRVLGRAPSAAELESRLGELQAGKVTFSQVEALMSERKEAQFNRTNPSLAVKPKRSIGERISRELQRYIRKLKGAAHVG